MTTFSDSEVRQRLDAVLEQARVQGEVRIRRMDGQEFVLRPAPVGRSSLDVGSVDAQLSTEDVVSAVRESRQRS